MSNDILFVSRLENIILSKALVVRYAEFADLQKENGKLDKRLKKACKKLWDIFWATIDRDDQYEESLEKAVANDISNQQWWHRAMSLMVTVNVVLLACLFKTVV
jgi:hypothetical protein